MKRQDGFVDNLRFLPKEIWAMWSALCMADTKNPYTSVLKAKLYRLLTREEHTKFRKMYESK